MLSCSPSHGLHLASFKWARVIRRDTFENTLQITRVPTTCKAILLNVAMEGLESYGQFDWTSVTRAHLSTNSS